MTDQMADIVEALEAGYQREYYSGIVKHAPFLLKEITPDEGDYMFKLRMLEAPLQKPRWDKVVPKAFANAKISCEFEGEYMFVWVKKVESLRGEEIAGLVPFFIERHSDHFPQTAGYCYHCREAGSAKLLEHESSIVTICDTCLVKRAREKIETERSINASDSTMLLYLPLAFLVSATGWGLFWFLYDVLFTSLNTDRLYVPQLVLWCVVLAVGAGLGWPNGKLIHRSGAAKKFPLHVVVGASVLVTIILGELLCMSILLYQYNGFWDIFVVAQLVWQANIENAAYLFIKFLFACAVFFGTRNFAEPKKGKLAL